jgi:hypothetical protein
MPAPELAPTLINQLIQWVAEYIASQRSHFAESALPIAPDFVKAVKSFFPEDVLKSVRVVRGRAAEPAFYPQLRAVGISNAPPFSDMAGITFKDVIVHIEPLTKPLLFHELVHALQYKHLGLKGFAEHYVRGFLSGGSYEEIPLEKQAYALEDKFTHRSASPFSVEDDVLERIRKNQF